MDRLVNLAAEWSGATAPIHQPHIERLLVKYDIPKAIGKLIGVGRVRVEGHHFDPDHNGREMMLITIFKFPPYLSNGSPRLVNEIIDIIAFDPATPSQWWSRCGNVAVLGEEMRYSLDEKSVLAVGNPLSWLRKGAMGVCPVDPDPAPVRDVLILLPSIYVEEEDVELGRKIKRLLDHHCNNVPTVYVRRRGEVEHDRT